MTEALLLPFVLLPPATALAVVLVQPAVTAGRRRWTRTGVAAWSFGVALVGLWVLAGVLDRHAQLESGAAPSALGGQGRVAAAAVLAVISVRTVRRTA